MSSRAEGGHKVGSPETQILTLALCTSFCTPRPEVYIATNNLLSRSQQHKIGNELQGHCYKFHLYTVRRFCHNEPKSCTCHSCKNLLNKKTMTKSSLSPSRMGIIKATLSMVNSVYLTYLFPEWSTFHFIEQEY